MGKARSSRRVCQACGQPFGSRRARQQHYVQVHMRVFIERGTKKGKSDGKQTEQK